MAEPIPSAREAQAAAPSSMPANAPQALPDGKVEQAAAPAPPVVAKQGLERAATDALARGDIALAQRIYAELAQSSPQHPAFREAARILAHSAGETP